MTEVVLLLLLFITLISIVKGFINREKIFEFSTLFHITLVAFLGGQIFYAYFKDVDILIISLYMLLCSLAILLGSRVTLKLGLLDFLITKRYLVNNRAFNAYVLCGIAIIAYVALSNSDTAMESQKWTGKDTVYNFFFIVYRLSFILAIIGYYKTRKKVYLVPLLLCLLIFLDKILINGKRTDFVYLVLIFFMARYLVLNKIPSLGTLVLGIASAPVILILLVALRTVTLDGYGFKTFQTFSGLVNVTEIYYEYQSIRNNESLISVEFEAARNSINQVWDNDLYTFGGNYWNDFVQDFVPSVLMGPNNKRLLKIPFRALKTNYGGYQILEGSTLTGYFDTFRSFSFLGCLIWFWFSALANSILNRARQGSEAYIFIYLALIVEFLHALTHRSSLLLTGILFVAIYFTFLYIIKVFKFL